MKIRFTETVLRDANQSLIATRMPFEDFAPILKTLDKAGYYSLECWGGATFDCCLRYLDEDPWERLRKIKKECQKTKLQMLLRGQNLLGYKHYSDDVVRMFVRKSVENGIDIIRIFDALGDTRNMAVAIDETLKCGAEPSGTICYTQSPVHTLESYVEFAKEIEKMGVKSICIKDMAGILSPQNAFSLVKALKSTVSVPIIVHTHCTTGLAAITLYESAKAGADIIDTAISSFSGGTSQPATETLAYALSVAGFDTGLDAAALRQINEHFKVVRSKALESGLLNPLLLGTDTDALSYQVPGGMLSNLVSQLQASNNIDKFEAVLNEVPIVRKDLGYPPLVTPISQMVGAQATSNVLNGERYKSISREIKNYVSGFYGKAPGEISPSLKKKILGDKETMTCRFADTLKPSFQSAKEEIGSLAKSDEDVLSYITFPNQALDFFKKREEKEKNTFKYTIKKIKD